MGATTTHAMSNGSMVAAVNNANILALFSAMACMQDALIQKDTQFGTDIANIWLEINKLKDNKVDEQIIRDAVINFFNSHPEITQLPCIIDHKGNKYSAISYIEKINSMPVETGWRSTPSSNPAKPWPINFISLTDQGNIVLTPTTDEPVYNDEFEKYELI